MRFIVTTAITVLLLNIHAGAQVSKATFTGKNLYCFIITDKYNKEGKETSFSDVKNYPYLFRYTFTGNQYSKTNSLREPAGRGSFMANGKALVLTDSDLKTPVKYTVTYFSLPYITLKYGDKTFYCLLN
jgi:hypothetical protein